MCSLTSKAPVALTCENVCTRELCRWKEVALKESFAAGSEPSQVKHVGSAGLATRHTLADTIPDGGWSGLLACLQSAH